MCSAYGIPFAFVDRVYMSLCGPPVRSCNRRRVGCGERKLGGILKAFRMALAGCAVAMSLAGCTYSDVSTETGPTNALPAPAAETAPPASVPVVLEGKFQTQAFPTTGTATIQATDSALTLELKDFSTEDAGELTVVFSPGTLSPNAEGEPGLTSDQLIVIDDLKQSSGTQTYELDARMWNAMPSPVSSVVIYNFPDRVAYGTANLIQVSPS